MLRAEVPAGSGGSDKRIADTVPYTGVRKIIGDRLSASKFSAPHIYFTDSVDTTNLTALRARINEESETKVAVSDLLILAASKALQIHGGYGYTTEYAVERFYREAKLFEIVEGTSEVQRLVIASRVLRESRRG